MDYGDRVDLARVAGSSMQRIVVSLLKGGVAKSETAVSLAHGLAMAGHQVLLVDTDVQAQCSDMLGVHPERGLADLIAGWKDDDHNLVEARENLFLLAGGNGLAGVKMEIARREMAPEAVLAETMATFEGRFDYLILDTAPGWDALLVNALYCSHLVLSPVSMEPMALSGLMRFEERLAVIQKYNTALKLKWVVPTFVDGRVKKTGEIMAQLEKRYGPRLAPPVRYSVKLSEAPAFGKTIYEHDPRGAAAQCYRDLTARILADAPPLRKPAPAGAEAGAGAEEGELRARLKTLRPRPVPRPAPDMPRMEPEPEPEVVVAMEPMPEPAVTPAPEPEPVRPVTMAPEPVVDAPTPEPVPEPRPAVAAASPRLSLKERLGARAEAAPAPPAQPEREPARPVWSLKERLRAAQRGSGAERWREDGGA